MRIIILAIATLLGTSACTFSPQRTGYDRKSGSWPDPSYKPPSSSSGLHDKSNQQASNGQTIEAPKGPLQKHIDPWIGTRYKFGGESKSGIDCSGFVMKVMNSWKGIKLPHSAKETFRFGKSVIKSDLQPGDVVFFGNSFSISHNGIYVGDGIFAHSSTSKGVMYEKLANSYWSPKYQGARRY